jgi:alpha-glucuronidase
VVLNNVNAEVATLTAPHLSRAVMIADDLRSWGIRVGLETLPTGRPTWDELVRQVDMGVHGVEEMADARAGLDASIDAQPHTAVGVQGGHVRRFRDVWLDRFRSLRTTERRWNRRRRQTTDPGDFSGGASAGRGGFSRTVVPAFQWGLIRMR